MATLVVNLTADTADFDAALGGAQDKLSSFSDWLGGGVQQLGKVVLAGAAAGALALGGAIATIGPAAVMAASDVNESMSKVQVVFGDSAGEIEAFAATTAQALGISRGDALAAAGAFGNLFVTMGLSQPAAAGMSQDIVQLAADLASFNNLDPTEVLEKLRSGLVGEAEPLRALGVNINEAAVAEKALELGLVGTNGELSEAAKVQARYALILDQTTTAQGDFARTSDGLANSLRQFSAIKQDMLVELGNVILPLVVEGLSYLKPILVDQIIPAFEGFVEKIGTVTSAIQSGMEPIEVLRVALNQFLPPETSAAIIEGIEKIIAGVQQIAAAVAPYIEQAAQWIGKNVEVQDVLLALGAAIAAVVVPALASAVAAVAPVIAAAVLLIAGIALVRKAWEEDWGGIASALTALWNGTLQPALSDLWAWLSVNVPAALQTLSDFWTNVLLPAIERFANWYSSNIVPLWSAAVAWFSATVPAALQTLSDYWTNVLLPAITAVWSWMDGTLFPFLRALSDFMGAVFGVALTALAGLWQNVLLPALTAVWNYISSTLKPIFVEIGGYLNDTFGPIIREIAGWLSDTLASAFNSVSSAIQGVTDWLETMAGKIANLKLPDWLTPGSPTPFETGLRGITAALREMDQVGLPTFMQQPATGYGSGPGQPVQVSQNFTWNVSGRDYDGMRDAAVALALWG